MEAVIATAATRSLALCLLAVSCQSSSSWEVSETKSQHLSHQACRISRKPDNLFRGMGLEFVRTSSGTRAYLNVYSMEFSPHLSDKSKTEVLICIDQEEHTFMAHRMEGGQRLLLTDDARLLLTKALSDKKSIVIRSGRFIVEIIADDFSKNHCQKIISCEKNKLTNF